MKARSFRFKIVLWSVLVSGAVLLAFAWGAWWSLHRDRLESLDESLSTFGIRHATRASTNADPERMETSLVEHFGEEKAANRAFAFLTEDGRELFRSPGWPEGIEPSDFPASDTLLDPQPNIPAPPARDDRERGKGGKRDRPVMVPVFTNKSVGDESYRVGVFANREVRLVIAANLREVSDEMGALRQAFLLALPGALLIVALGAWFIALRALRPISVLRRDMKHVSAEALDSRLEVSGAAKEFAGIIDQYNAMLERLERSFLQATRFSADASHELKTPLAIMQGTLERALSESDGDPERQAVFSDLLEQTDRQKAVLENLLLLSRADSGQLKISAKPLDFSAAVETWLEDADFLAEDRDIQIESRIAPGVWIEGDENLLQQAAHNLFSNAVRHNVAGGEIECELLVSGAEAIWIIANTGPLLEESERVKVFERFYRGDSADTGGTGLGLSLVREIVTAHGGTVTASVEEGRNVFRVLLPIITSP